MYRASWIKAKDEDLTPFGLLLANFMPRAKFHRWSNGLGWCFRVYAIRPLLRCCVLDVTRLHGEWNINLFGCRFHSKKWERVVGPKNVR